MKVASPNNGTSPASLISEKYSSLEYLKKDAISLGLNEMKSNATFNGVADYRVKAAGSDAPQKSGQRGALSGRIRRVEACSPCRCFEVRSAAYRCCQRRPDKVRMVQRVNATVAEYVITLTNDGNRALAPVYVRDLFPSGTEFISSSVKPSMLSSSDANWTILQLGIGNTLTITLKLNVTDEASSNLINRVEVVGLAGDIYVSAANYSSLESGFLGCCQPQVTIDKKSSIGLSRSVRSALHHYG